MNHDFFTSDDLSFKLLQGNTLDVLPTIEKNSIDLIFTDPPYFLSNGGSTIQSGEIVSVNKGDWDKFTTSDDVLEFTRNWLTQCQRVLKPSGSIWISGTHHNIFMIGTLLNELGFKFLNMVTWQKPNPPPNFSCRYFTYSAEWIIWARKSPKVPHCFNYDVIKHLNGDKQMKDVWLLPSSGRLEKTQGKHPTQKPLGLLSRIILASSNENDTVLDLFSGSASTGIAANLMNRRYIGIEREQEFLDLSVRRYHELSNTEHREQLKALIKKQIEKSV